MPVEPVLRKITVKYPFRVSTTARQRRLSLALPRETKRKRRSRLLHIIKVSEMTISVVVVYEEARSWENTTDQVDCQGTRSAIRSPPQRTGE